MFIYNFNYLFIGVLFVQRVKLRWEYEPVIPGADFFRSCARGEIPRLTLCWRESPFHFDSLTVVNKGQANEI